MADILNQIPHTVLSHVRWALGTIARFNDAIRQCRAVEAYTGAMGRYEWEYRTGATGQTRAKHAQKTARPPGGLRRLVRINCVNSAFITEFKESPNSLAVFCA
jgi:hypothetical protein